MSDETDYELLTLTQFKAFRADLAAAREALRECAGKMYLDERQAIAGKVLAGPPGSSPTACVCPFPRDACPACDNPCRACRLARDAGAPLNPEKP